MSATNNLEKKTSEEDQDQEMLPQLSDEQLAKILEVSLQQNFLLRNA